MSTQAETTKLYELVDATDNDQYYTLGIFVSKDQALSYLDGDVPPDTGSVSFGFLFSTL